MSVRGLRNLEQRFIQNDQKITADEAKQLVDSTADWGGVSKGEKTELSRILQRNVDKLEPAARDILTRFLGTGPTPPPPPVNPGGGATPAGPVVNLDPSGATRPVFLNANGVFTANADGRPPANALELGDALFRAGDVADNAREPMLKGQPLASREKVFEQLKATLASVPPGGAPPAGLDANQALQLRSSSATVLLDLINASPEASLRDAAAKHYESMVKTESDPRLRESMIFHLSNSAAASSPGPVKTISDGLISTLAPMKPPYEKWFANGNSTVNLSWTVGQGEFWGGFTNYLKQHGFKPVGQESEHGVSTYEAKINKPGVGETTFRISVRQGGTDILNPMDDPNVHVVGYDGHSNWGRNMSSSVKNGPDSPNGGDGKLLFYNLCVGKGILDRVKEKYENTQVVTTYAASNFYTDGNGQMTRGEGVQALVALVDGIAGRKGWPDIHQKMNDAADIGWGRTWDNYLTPISTLTREKVLDRDNDGQADYLDKHFNYSTFNVPTDTAREFTPVKQDRDTAVLDGTKVLVSANMINTLSEFSGILERYNPDSKVVAGGWFDPKPGESSVFRFAEQRGRDGKPEVVMQVNSRYAHMSEEAMRASSVYEFSKWLGDSGKLSQRDPVENKLAAMLAFGQSLSVDEGYRDREIWGNFLQRYNLPADIDQGKVTSALGAHQGHAYAGDANGVRALKAALSPDTLAQLSKPEVGVPVRIL